MSALARASQDGSRPGLLDSGDEKSSSQVNGMYCEFYNFREPPFQVSPDHRFFFAGGPHRRAEAYLTFGLGQGDGFIVVTGEIGAGKTTLIQHVLSKLAPAQRSLTAQIVTTQLDADSLVHMVAAAFGLPQSHENKALVLCQLERHFQDRHRAGRRCLLFVDEVQNLSYTALEELRMLSNFQLDGRGLLQICLVGQPEFKRTLAGPKLEQLRQRVISNFHLSPLNAEDTRGYIEHRLREVGWQDDPRFASEAFELIHETSGGVPRTINLICNRLLFFSCLDEAHEVSADSVRQVVEEMRSEGLPALSPSAAASSQREDAGVTAGAAAAADPAPKNEDEAKKAASELARFSRGLNILKQALQKTDVNLR